MSEEDTFKALKKPSLEEMDRLYVEEYCRVQENRWSVEAAREFLKKYGWTYEEFLQKALNIHDRQY